MALVLLMGLAGGGCQAQVDSSARGVKRPASGPANPMRMVLSAPVLSEAVFDEDVEAWVRVPQGWRVDPVKRTEKHVHKTWLSETGETAYGVIWVKLPLPINEEMFLWGFMREMKKSEGEASLLSKGWDAEKGVLRFEAEGGKYSIQTVLTTRGLTAWAVYAGTLKGHEPVEEELAAAVAARDGTRVGR